MPPKNHPYISSYLVQRGRVSTLSGSQPREATAVLKRGETQGFLNVSGGQPIEATGTQPKKPPRKITFAYPPVTSIQLPSSSNITHPPTPSHISPPSFPPNVPPPYKSLAIKSKPPISSRLGQVGQSSATLNKGGPSTPIPQVHSPLRPILGQLDRW